MPRQLRALTAPLLPLLLLAGASAHRAPSTAGTHHTLAEGRPGAPAAQQCLTDTKPSCTVNTMKLSDYPTPSLTVDASAGEPTISAARTAAMAARLDFLDMT